MKKCIQNYDAIMTFENIFLAWKEFVRDKIKKPDVVFFQSKLMDNLFALHEDLSNNTYRHGRYTAFKINDPKPRDIHKATVRDRVVHHLLYNALYDFFDKTFVYDSYSCRKNKGTHKALKRFDDFALKVSRNNTRTCWILKCDIRKFFASVDVHCEKRRVGWIGIEVGPGTYPVDPAAIAHVFGGVDERAGQNSHTKMP